LKEEKEKERRWKTQREEIELAMDLQSFLDGDSKSKPAASAQFSETSLTQAVGLLIENNPPLPSSKKKRPY